MKRLLLLACITFILPNIHGDGVVQGTLIRVIDGYITVQHIKSNDKIVGLNENGLMALMPVRHTTKSTTDSVVIITIDDTSFFVTEDQLIFSIDQNKWIQAAKLEIGETIASLSGGKVIHNVELIAPTCETLNTYKIIEMSIGVFCISPHDIFVYNSPHSVWRTAGQSALDAATDIAKAAWAVVLFLAQNFIEHKFGQLVGIT